MWDQLFDRNIFTIIENFIDFLFLENDSLLRIKKINSYLFFTT